MWSPDPQIIVTAEQREAEQVAASLTRLRALLDAATRPILDGYPEAERLSWPAKETEALAVLADETAEAPLLVAEIAAQQAVAPATVTPAEIAAKAALVLAKAATWRALVSAISGIRQRAEAALAGATNDTDREAVLGEVAVEIAGLAV
jgi:hypothetical protein